MQFRIAMRIITLKLFGIDDDMKILRACFDGISKHARSFLEPIKEIVIM